MKCKTPSNAKAMLRHCDRDERLKTKEHSNRELDKSKTKHNAQFKYDYQETVERYEKRISDLDATTNTNKRKDRITMFMLETVVPDGLSGAKARDWMDKCLEAVYDMYGSKNVINAYIHRDETHEYIDEDNKKKMSREHIHIAVVPEHEGVLNGKWFSSRSNMMKLNNSLQKMTQSEFNCDYMTGRNKKRSKTVEELKYDSNVKQAVNELLADREKALSDAERRFEAQRDKSLEDLQNRSERLSEGERALKQDREKFEQEKEYIEKEKKHIKYSNQVLQGEIESLLKIKNRLTQEDKQRLRRAKQVSSDMESNDYSDDYSR